MRDISLLLAFSAGLLSFLSPCVLPLVPAYITYLTGTSVSELKTGRARLYTIYKALGFVLGFSVVFVAMGATISSLGQALASNQVLFRRIGGIVVIIFGFHTTGLIKIKALYYEKRAVPMESLKSNIGSVFVGMAFAAGWTPCVGPILGSILIYAGSMATIRKGIILLIAYSIGLAIPFLITAAAISSLTKFLPKLSKHLPVISVISGILMILLGVAIYTNSLLWLSQYFNFFKSF